MYPLLITKTPSHRKDEVVTHVRLHTYYTCNSGLPTHTHTHTFPQHPEREMTTIITIYTFVSYSLKTILALWLNCWEILNKKEHFFCF